ncbi:phosphodiester glycosidase family protein [Planomicrobium sp. CPCC 101079]|uniref:phosphodiester glycosidase family protein n=1 Tax=Planomicrobium sp. CPCC 101079 TaxID=2599618 RepID=UPI001C95F571|nr:phosphodiester glycosidase family protein [Planomicrobium sp. CPCC 101079]
MESAESGSTTSTAEQESEEAASSAAITDTSYEDEQIQITIDTEKTDNTTFYVADIQVSDASYLKTALAGDTYGRNIKAATSETAGSNGAILAINGDYYGFRDEGYVLRNGVLYRDTARNSEEDDALVIDIEGNFSIISENETSLSSIDTSSIAQILSFGPSLIEDGEITVDGSSEVSRSMSGNPRTAIGQIDPLHYIIIVSDGRTSESEGLSLLELAEEMQERGAETAYNLDGGGSSTLYFNGEIINNPTDGREMGEREVSDIVYIGY